MPAKPTPPALLDLVADPPPTKPPAGGQGGRQLQLLRLRLASYSRTMNQ